MNHIDEEARNKTMQFNDFKTQMSWGISGVDFQRLRNQSLHHAFDKDDFLRDETMKRCPEIYD